MSVDLPAPLGPSRPKMPPCGTSKLTPLSASLGELVALRGVFLDQVADGDGGAVFAHGERL